MSLADAITIMSKGRANPSLYQVVMPDTVTGSAGREFNEYISYFCRSLIIPASSNSLMGLTGHDSVGITRNIITGRNYGSPAVFTFTDRTDLIVYKTIKQWLDSSVLNSEQTNGAFRDLRVRYYNEIKCDITIRKLEAIGKPSRESTGIRDDMKVTGEWTLINCVPMAIEQTSMGVEAADAVLDFIMSVAFESYKFTEKDEPFGSISALRNRSVRSLNQIFSQV